MTAEPKDEGADKGSRSAGEHEKTDIMKESFKRETSKARQEQEEDHMEGTRRSMVGRPIDPNSSTAKVNFPPGIDSQDMFDPGRATPEAPPPDDPSAKKKKDKK